MPIPNSRTREAASTVIDYNKCNACGLCVSVCKDFSLKIVEEKLIISDTPLFGCIACGHCMAICPSNAIHIFGRDLTPDSLIELKSNSNSSNYDELQNLLIRRRSIREFSDKPVEKEIIEKILSAARTAPMGIPPSDVNVLVLDSKSKNRKFASEFCKLVAEMKWLTSDSFLKILKPFIGKDNYDLMKSFAKPLVNAYLDNDANGINLVTYDAPLAFYFYGTPFSDPADPIIAATYAMLAAESLGLGTCMVGAIHPLIQNGKKAAKFRAENGIKFKSREGLFVLVGYSKVHYHKSIKRDFASINYYNKEE